MLRKTQTYIAMFSMVGVGVFAPVEAAEYSPVIHTDVSQLDWSKNIHRADKGSSSESLREAELEELLKDPQFQKLPSEWQKAIIENVDYFSVDNEHYKTYLDSPMLEVIKKYGQLTALPKRMDVIRGWIGLPQPEEPLNPKTGKAYVQVPKSLVAGLTPAEILYVKKVLKVINQNLHYLNSLPPTMDPKKLEQGDYIGYAFVPLTLVQPKVLYEDWPHPTKMGMGRKGHQELVDMFAEGDEELYRLQSQMGTALYNPHLINPKYRFTPGLDCYGFNRGKPLGLRTIVLGYCNRFNYQTLHAYQIYFEETAKSFPILRAGLTAEAALRADQPKLHKVLTHIQAQTEPYLEKMERAVNYMKNQIKLYNTKLEPEYQDISGAGNRLLDVRISKGVDVPEKTEKELTPKEKRLLKKQERQREKELEKQQRQRS